MDRTRIWLLASGAAVVAILAGGFFIGVQPQLAAADTADVATAQVDAQNQQTGARLAALAKTAATAPAMRAENDALFVSVPDILKPNRFIRRVNEVATLDGAAVQSVTLGEAIPYAIPGSATGTAGTGLAKVDPLITAANFAIVPATVAVTGQKDAVVQFAHDIQADQRMYDVASLQLSRDEQSSKVTATLDGYIYTLKR